MISVKNVLIKLKLLKMCFFEKRGWTKHPGNSPMSRAPDSSPFWGSSRKGDNRFILVKLGRMAYGKKWLKLPLRSLRVLESSLSSVQAERLREWRLSVGSEVVHEAGEAGRRCWKTPQERGPWAESGKQELAHSAPLAMASSSPGECTGHWRIAPNFTDQHLSSRVCELKYSLSYQ